MDSQLSFGSSLSLTVLLNVAVLWLEGFGVRKPCVFSQTEMTYLWKQALAADNTEEEKVPVSVSSRQYEWSSLSVS